MYVDDRTFERISFILIVGFLVWQIFYLRPPFSYLKPSEPYPALLLPAGEQLFYDNGQLHYSFYEIEIFSKDGAVQSISQNELLNTVPIAHREKIIRNNFGLPDSIPEQPNKKTREGISWLKTRIKKLTGFKLKLISHIQIHYMRATRDFDKSEKSIKLLDSKTIYLD